MITQTAEEFVADMEALAVSFGQDVQEPLELCIDIIGAGIQSNFENSRTAGGVPWPPRKDPGPKHPLLILTTALSTAAVFGNVQRIEGNTLFYGVSADAIPYARTHQEGDKSRNIAQREYLGFSEVTINNCCEVFADFALGEFD